ncbi:MAG TPA: hypothetical protein PK754_15455 [bacterium]|nr:hypothetical protein [bacterium]
MLKLTAHILLTNDFEQYAHREIYGVTFVERLIRQCKELKAHTINVWSEKIMFVHSDVYCHPFNEWNQYMSQLRVREEERIIIIDSNIIADDRLKISGQSHGFVGNYKSVPHSWSKYFQIG